TGNTALTVNHTSPNPNSLNKTLHVTTLEIGANNLAVTNSSGYGLQITGQTTLSGGVPNFSVANATASNVIQGLILSGYVTDGGADLGIIKSGSGTMVLSNNSTTPGSANDFGGSGQTIDIRKGVLAATSDAALGNSNNTITLDANFSTGAGFRAMGSFATARTFVLNQPNDAIEVTVGNT